jgi:hypothetical protein
MLGARLRSPLRWLWTVFGSLSVLAAAGLTGIAWFLVALPVIWGLFLLAPPVGVFRHDEPSAKKTRIVLETRRVRDPAQSTVVVEIAAKNVGETDATGYRLRLLIPHEYAPPDHPIQLIRAIHVGKLGREWYTESVEGAQALAFRANLAPGATATCPAQACLPLIQLQFPAGRIGSESVLAYQVNGGNVVNTLDSVPLVSD